MHGRPGQIIGIILDDDKAVLCGNSGNLIPSGVGHGGGGGILHPGHEIEPFDVVPPAGHIKAFRHLPKFDGRSRLSTWLYRIATNEALMMIRRRKGVMISVDEPFAKDDEDSGPLEIVDWCCLPENELMSAEARQYLDEAVEALPHSLRVVFLLRDIEGLSTRETGEVLNLSETAVKTRLSRARFRLRELLTGYYGKRMKRSAAKKEGS